MHALGYEKLQRRGSKKTPQILTNLDLEFTKNSFGPERLECHYRRELLNIMKTKYSTSSLDDRDRSVPVILVPESLGNGWALTNRCAFLVAVSEGKATTYDEWGERVRDLNVISIRPLTFWDLVLADKVGWAYFYFRERSRRRLPIARAGWSNLLSALDITSDIYDENRDPNFDIISWATEQVEDFKPKVYTDDDETDDACTNGECTDGESTDAESNHGGDANAITAADEPPARPWLRRISTFGKTEPKLQIKERPTSGLAASSDDSESTRSSSNEKQVKTIQRPNVRAEKIGADTIPTSVDVAPQKIPIVELAKICYYLGVRNVTLDVVKGLIKAESIYLDVSTKHIPELGQVVTINGDFDKLWQEISVLDNEALINPGNWAGGEFDNYMDIHFMDKDALLRSLVNCEYVGDIDRRAKARERKEAATEDRTKIIQDKLVDGFEQYQEYLKSVSPREQCLIFLTQFWQENSSSAVAPSEASSNEQTPSNQVYATQVVGAELAMANIETPISSDSWVRFWENKIESRTPRLYMMLPILCVPVTWCSIPKSIFLTPYLDYTRTSMNNWYAYQTDPQKSKLWLGVSSDIDKDLFNGTINFLHFKRRSRIMVEGTLAPRTPLENLGKESLDYIQTGWLLHASIRAVHRWNSTIAEEAFGHTNELQLPQYVLDLLGRRTIPQMKERDAIDSIYRDGSTILEQSVFLSLLLVDCRLQGLWCRAACTTPEIYDEKHTTSLLHVYRHKPQVQFPLYHGQNLIVGFLALWFEICKRVDVLQTTDLLLDAMNKILEEWKDDKRLTVDDDGLDKFPRFWTRRYFSTWANENTRRKEALERMIPVLQLRIFLMVIMFELMGDSTAYALARERGANGVEITVI